jgi:hypothetical protein
MTLSRALFTLLTLAALSAASAASAAAQPAGMPGTTIVVNTTTDLNVIPFPPAPPPCRLRDAIVAANENRAVGGCKAGVAPRIRSASPLVIDGIDQIVFNVGAGTPKIVLRAGLPNITEAVTINGATGGATRVEVNGANIWSYFGPVHGFVITGTDTTLKNLVVNSFSGSGIVLAKLDGEGIVIVTPGRPERPEPGLEGGPCGPSSYPADPDQCKLPGGNPDDDVVVIGETGGGGHNVFGCLIGTDSAGKAALPNGDGTGETAGIVVLTAGNAIGGPAKEQRNLISGNEGHGVLIDGVNNRAENNLIGTDVDGRFALPNDLDGVFVAGGRFANASCVVTGNTIALNRGNGVSGGFNRCTVLSNRIYENGLLGIDMGDSGLTLNDANGFLAPVNFPVITSVTTQFDPLFGVRTTIQGTVTHQNLGTVRVQLFQAWSCDPSGHGEGDAFLGETSVGGSGTRNFTINLRGLLFNSDLTATATVADRTSEFSACY